MKAGEIVLARVNEGQWEEAEVIEIHGDIARVCGVKEMALVRSLGRAPLGVGFPIKSLRSNKKANHA